MRTPSISTTVRPARKRAGTRVSTSEPPGPTRADSKFFDLPGPTRPELTSSRFTPRQAPRGPAAGSLQPSRLDARSHSTPMKGQHGANRDVTDRYRIYFKRVTRYCTTALEAHKALCGHLRLATPQYCSAKVTSQIRLACVPCAQLDLGKSSGDQPNSFGVCFPSVHLGSWLTLVTCQIYLACVS